MIPRQVSKDQMPFWGSVNFVLSSGGATEECSLICALELLPRGTVRTGLDLEGRSRRLLATWVCNSGEMKLEERRAHLERQHGRGH